MRTRLFLRGWYACAECASNLLRLKKQCCLLFGDDTTRSRGRFNCQIKKPLWLIIDCAFPRTAMPINLWWGLVPTVLPRPCACGGQQRMRPEYCQHDRRCSDRDTAGRKTPLRSVAHAHALFLPPTRLGSMRAACSLPYCYCLDTRYRRTLSKKQQSH